MWNNVSVVDRCSSSSGAEAACIVQSVTHNSYLFGSLLFTESLLCSWWRGSWEAFRKDKMFPCVSSWPSAEATAPLDYAPSAPAAQTPDQTLPDLLRGCATLSAPPLSPCTVDMESLIVVTEYEPSGGRMGNVEEEEPEEMDSSETPELASAPPAPFHAPSCDLLSHTASRPEALFPQAQEHRGRLNLSDRKLSLQERSHTLSSPCGSPGLNGRYIYPSLPYSPITSPHSSPRLPRRPTVESHRVSITDLQVASWFDIFIFQLI